LNKLKLIQFSNLLYNFYTINSSRKLKNLRPRTMSAF